MATYMKEGVASSIEIERELCERVDQIPLARNVTQKQLAEQTGLSKRTIERFAKGEGTSLDTFIRNLQALNIAQNLFAILPDPSVRPVERIERGGQERQRARPDVSPDDEGEWEWGDD